MHALGDYVSTIREFGTTDSYSTETVCDRLRASSSDLSLLMSVTQGELEHRTSKARYGRTSRKDYIKQMTRLERRQSRLRHIREKLGTQKTVMDDEVASTGTPDLHHYIGKSQNTPLHIGTYLQRYAGDPAIKVSPLLRCLSLIVTDPISSTSGLCAEVEESSLTTDEGRDAAQANQVGSICRLRVCYTV
jgi:hypothetical protein